MSAEDRAPCALGIAPATLSAWHDRMARPAEAERLQGHIPTCAACQATLAEFTAIDVALRNAPVANRRAASFGQDSLWRSIRPIIHQQQGVPDMRLSKRMTWSGVGVLAAAVLAIVLFALIVNKATVRPVSSTPTTTTFTASQAWGTTYKWSLPLGTAADDPTGQTALTNIFIPTDIAPDGSFLVGYITDQHGANSIAQVNVATGKTQQLAQFTPNSATQSFIGQVETDGSSVVWLVQTLNINYNTDQSQLEVLDLHTMQTKAINIGISYGFNNGQYGSIYSISFIFNQGVVYYENNNGNDATIQATDISSGKTKQLVTDVLATTLTQRNISYPYLLYQTSDKAYHIVNIQTGADSALPPDPLGRESADWTIAGTTVYADITSVDQSSVVRKVLQLPHANQPGAQWQDAAVYPFTATGVNTILNGVNDRLFVLLKGQGQNSGGSLFTALVAWDRTQQHIVALAPQLAPQSAPILRGQWLAWIDIDAAQHVTLNLVDSNTLPTAPTNK